MNHENITSQPENSEEAPNNYQEKIEQLKIEKPEQGIELSSQVLDELMSEVPRREDLGSLINKRMEQGAHGEAVLLSNMVSLRTQLEISHQNFTRRQEKSVGKSLTNMDVSLMLPDTEKMQQCVDRHTGYYEGDTNPTRRALMEKLQYLAAIEQQTRSLVENPSYKEEK